MRVRRFMSTGLLVGVVLGLAGPSSAAPITNPVGTPTAGFDAGFVLINFDDVATGFVYGLSYGGYAALGLVDMSQVDGVSGPLETFASTQSAPNYVGTGDNNGWNGDVWFTLAGGTDRIGIGIADSAGTVETIYAYDSSLNLLESFVVPNCVNCWYGFDRASADIAYFRLSGGFFAFDNLVYNQIPEPATVGLLSIGLLAAGIRRHRRQQKSR